MKKITAVLLACLLAAALFLTSCNKEAKSGEGGVSLVKEDISEFLLSDTIDSAEPVNETFTFVPQAICPIEENPAVFEMGDFSGGGNLEAVQLPSFDGSISSLLTAPEEILYYEGQAVLDNMNHGMYEDGSEGKTLECEGNIVTCSLPENGMGCISFYELSETVAASVKESFAVLYKIRFTGIPQNAQFMIEINGTRVEININDRAYHAFAAFTENEQFFPNENTEFRLESGELYDIMVSLDRSNNYTYLIWQDTDPTNNAYKTYDLGSIAAPQSGDPHHYVSEVSVFADGKAAGFDLESVTLMGYDAKTDAEENALEYSNDYEKYRLAVDLFESEDYYNAYLLLVELDGYGTSGSYLAECERLLKTVEVNSPLMAAAVRRAMSEQGMYMHSNLYAYQAEKIESLDFTRCGIEDMSFIKSFCNLKKLTLDGNAISDITPLSELYSLEYLSAARNNITDLLPLQNLTALEYLDLSENLIEKADGIGGLSSLRELNISINSLYSIDALYGLESLEKADFSDNFICSVGALSVSPIKELNIFNTNIDNLHAISGLTGLETLYCGFKFFPNASNMSFNARASKYWLSDHWWMGMTGLKGLEGLPNLKYLFLARLEAGYDEDALEPLATLPSLESLLFYIYSGAHGASTLSKLTNLKELALDGVGDTSCLEKLTKLEKLTIMPFCYVNDINMIAGLTNLKELRMYKYSDDLSFIAGLHNLRLLDLNGWGNVYDYSPLLELENLEYLNLGEMELENISDIFRINTLKYLNIDNYQEDIKSISGLDGLTELEHFNITVGSCEDPALADPSFFQIFDKMGNLRVSVLNGKNSCSYGYGDEDIFEPSSRYVKQTGCDNYSIWSEESLRQLSEFRSEQTLEIVIESGFPYDGEPLKLIIPHNIRNLYISSYIAGRVKVELDLSSCAGLERVVVGEMYRLGDGPFEWGRGSFSIENLDAFANCANLREVVISGAGICDISGLAGCENLRIVQLRDNNISDLSALSGKKYLRTLDISDNDIKSVEPLLSCIRLETVELGGNPVKGAKALLDVLPLYNK